MKGKLSLKDWMTRKGYWTTSVPTSLPGFQQVEYRPEQVVGLIVHSFLSGSPHGNILTDGKSVYFNKDEPLPPNPDQNLKDDLVRESFIHKLITGREEPLVYPAPKVGIGEGHLRLNDFSDLLLPYNPLAQYGDVSHQRQHLILRDEEVKLRRRLSRNKVALNELLDVLDVEGEPLSSYALGLKSRLEVYKKPVKKTDPRD